MAIAPAMTPRSDAGDNADDGHEHDVVMPGFRFHPTEEELIEFYLRRKVEGKRFNVELITFLDLYRYDPWELPALAAIGEKEWFFYVPRDKKYRNGDRPNRVTTSGYWKATGADRMIRSETSRPIGLKKTLVFYSGKAPRGTRTSWIMNEYRLPQNETSRSQKAEISLCRVYKRPGVPGDHQPPAGTAQARPLSSSSSRPPLHSDKKSGPTAHRTTTIFPGLIGEPSSSDAINHGPNYTGSAMAIDSGQSEMESFVPNCPLLSFSTSSSMPAATVDELNRLMGLHHQGSHLIHMPQGPSPSPPAPPPQQQQHLLSPSLANPMGTLSPDKFWDWNQIP